MKKLKVLLKDDKIISKIFEDITNKYSDLSPNTDDGVRIDFEEGWVHMRKSNTEPIVRIFSESKDQEKADNLALRFKKRLYH
jgi:phosphomannomutase